MTPRPPQRLLTIGAVDSPELRSVSRALSSLPNVEPRGLSADDAAWLHKGAEALDTIEQDGWFPEIVVVCQSWSDEFAPEVAAGLLARWPLARWVCVYGRWCESDGRTRAIWPGAVRVPADRAGSRILHEIEVLAGRELPLPLTASRDEAFAFDFADRSRAVTRPIRRESVAVWTADEKFFAMLSDALRAEGHDVVRAGEAPSLRTLVCDWEPWLTAPSEVIARWRREQPESRIVALASWCGPEVERAARKLGADAVVAKLSGIEDVYAAMGA